MTFNDLTRSLWRPGLWIAVTLAVYIMFPASPIGSPVRPPALTKMERIADSGEKVVARFHRLPLQFEPNRGQAPEAIRFAARGAGFGLFLEDNGMRIVMPQTSPPNPTVSRGSDQKEEPAVIRLGWTPPHPRHPFGEEILETDVHYLIGNDPSRWQTGIRPYRRVRYPEVYPGIDLVIYGNQQRPEYDFVLAPGSDPHAIRLFIDGTKPLSLDAEGRLLLETSAGTLIQSAPVIYQVIQGERKTVEGGYVLHGGNQLGFTVNSYDPKHVLIIDPVLLTRTYSTFLGGSGAETGLGIAVDSSGNAYVTGRTASADYPTQNAFQGALGGGSGSDAFIAKLNSDGSALVYSTYLGGSGFEEGLGIAVDSSGQAHVTGRTTSTNFPTQSALQGALSGGAGEDAFVSKLSADGSTLLYSTYLGGTGTDEGLAIDVDSSGNAYITGFTDSTNFPTSSARQGALAGGSGEDAFVSKINASGGAFVYSTYHGGTGNDRGKGIAADSSGNAYITGSTLSTDFPTQGAFQSAIGDGSGTASDAFVSKLNSTGATLTFSTYLGGTGAEVGNGIAVDTASKVYVVGRTASTNFPTQEPLQSSLGGGSGTDAFVTRMLADGSALEYSTYLGGSAFDEGLAVRVDLSQNAYVSGRTDSTDFAVTNAVQSSLGGGSGTDGFAAQVNSFGTGLTWATYVGGSGTDQATGIAVDSNQDAYLIGFTGSNDFPTQAALQSTLGGGGLDAFVVKITVTETNPELLPSTTVISPYWQTGDDLYTFIAISHPSLAGMSSQIGVRALAFLHSGPQFAAATDFTVSAGETHRLFITHPNDPTINATNIPTASFILGTTNSSGWARFAPIASDPAAAFPGAGGGFPDITMLSYWGAVVIKDGNTGFAVSFIGDAADSVSHPAATSGLLPSGLK